MATPNRSRLQREAVKAFRATKAGKLLLNTKRQVESGKATVKYLQSQGRRLSAATGLSTARELMSAMGMSEEYDLIERYAGKENVLKRLGKWLGAPGKLISSILTGGKRRGPSIKQEAEFEVAINLLEAAGYTVSKPGGKGLPGWKALSGQSAAILQQALDYEAGKTSEQNKVASDWIRRLNNPEPVTLQLQPAMQFTGGAPEMISVNSSNVHSIGFAPETDYTGTLFVRYLADLGEGKRGGPGSLYEYYNVPITLFNRFRIASSKGGFVWDELRIRGTVSGHQFNYDLAGITGNYVPRRAQLKYVRGPRGGLVAAEHFVPRGHTIGEIQGGRMQMKRLRSQLPEQRVGRFQMRGPSRRSLRGS